MGQKAINLIVDDDNNNQRFDKAVALLLQDFSRMTIKNWINSGNVLLDNHTAEPKTKVFKGQKIQVFPISHYNNPTRSVHNRPGFGHANWRACDSN